MGRKKKIEILKDNKHEARKMYVEFVDTIKGEATEEQKDELKRLQEAIIARNEEYQEYYVKTLKKK